MKYSSTVQAERVKALTRGKTKSEMVIVEKEKNLMAQHRSSSLEKPYGEAVGLGLFDAANVACTIVDICLQWIFQKIAPFDTTVMVVPMLNTTSP
ncbi:hypothetical protein COOONC_15103 [Cooperia oncophora]